MIIFQSIKFWQPGSNKWSCNYIAENMSWYIYWHELFCLFAKYRGRMMRNIHHNFSIDFNKRYGRKFSTCSIIIDLNKTCSFCTKINFFVIRWWCMGSQFDLLDGETVILLSKCTNSMTVSELICINVWWPIIQWWRRINLITYPSVLDLFYYILLVWTPFPPLVRERQLIFHLSGINAAINHY